MSDLATVQLHALEWFVMAFKHEHGEHGRDCWKCNAAHDELERVDEAQAQAIADALGPDDELEVAA